jgi:predicted MPP superfamily phosphohydrolase
VIAVFLAVVLLVTAGIHLYLWKRLVRDTTTPGRWRRVGTAGVVVLVAVLIGGLFGGRALSLSAQRWLAWPAYVWLGLMFYLLVVLLALEVPRLALRWWVRRRLAQPAAAAHPVAPEPALVGAAGHGGHGPTEAPAPRARRNGRAPDPSRRLLLARSLAAAAGVTAVATVGYGMTQALGAPRLRRVRIPLAKLPRRIDGLRIALVSDIHLGPLLGRAHTQRVVDTINAADADLVAVVGDLVDGTVDELGPAVAPLRGLRARHGSFFVTGNHEYFSGYAPWLDEVGALGLRVLQNERVELDGLDLAGVNDVTGGEYAHGPDFGQALAGRDPARPVVLLAHQPVQAHEAARHGVDLQLSGHTHGGQMRPFDLVVGAQQPVLSGLGTVDGVPVYVTNGAGFWGPPVRVGAPPDVTVVELRAP